MNQDLDVPLPIPGSKELPRVVGIGASAGELQAFTEFLQQMPSDSGLAFVLVQHLDPYQPSFLPKILAAHTVMPVNVITHQTLVAPNHVYLIPPNSLLRIAGGCLYLEPPTELFGRGYPIDQFFFSLANDLGTRAVGIILSGSGADGADGLAAIRARGGLTIAQRPGSATYPAMPQTAIARGAVDHILDVAAMPALLGAWAKRAVPLPEPLEARSGFVPDTLHMITSLLQQVTGHDFSQYKRSTLQRRIERRMQMLRLSNLEVYASRLQQDRGEITQLFQDLLIGVTEFFRDPVAFEALAPTILPNLLRMKDAGVPLRVWVPGCATGEEAYSIAIVLHEQFAQLDRPPPIQIFATDIDESALATARRGFYDTSITHHVTPERLERYFTLDGQRYQVIKAIRELCLFSVHNLISDPPFGRMDLISCRNLLIYFDAELQRKLIPVFHYALNSGGYLFLGAAESAAGITVASDLFRVIDRHHRIYQRKDRLIYPQLTLPWASTNRPIPRISGSSTPPRPLQLSDFGAILERILIQEYAPTAVIIDSQGTIAYLSGRTHPLLSVPSGLPTTNLLAMVHSDLRLPLRAAIRAVIETPKPVVREDLSLLTSEGWLQITLTVRPFHEVGSEVGLILVILQSTTVARSVEQPPVDSAQVGNGSSNTIAQELQRTRDTLETTIGELQEANFDLTAANEELRSLNEELHAANEELQTSKEEIQSINEELQTVNVELNRKIEELDRVNADLVNLFASIQIPAIFLHANGRIARFTPQATELFALLDSDIGRSITDLNARFSHGDIRPLMSRVLTTLSPIEMVVHQPEADRWWSLRIRLYYTLANVIDGVVLTFAEITMLKRAEFVLKQAHDELERQAAIRTGDLLQTNQELQQQVEQWSRAEQVRLELLQRLIQAHREGDQRLVERLREQAGPGLDPLIHDLLTFRPEVGT